MKSATTKPTFKKIHIYDIYFTLTAALQRIIKGDISQKLHCICQNPDPFNNSKEFYSYGLFVSEIYQLNYKTTYYHFSQKCQD